MSEVTSTCPPAELKLPEEKKKEKKKPTHVSKKAKKNTITKKVTNRSLSKENIPTTSNIVVHTSATNRNPIFRLSKFQFRECRTSNGESYFEAQVTADKHTFYGCGITKKLAKAKAKKEFYKHFSKNKEGKTIPNPKQNVSNLSKNEKPLCKVKVSSQNPKSLISEHNVSKICKTIEENPLCMLNKLNLKEAYVVQESKTSTGQSYFQAEVIIGDKHFYGTGTSKKMAKTEAAKEALKHFSDTSMTQNEVEIKKKETINQSLLKQNVHQLFKEIKTNDNIPDDRNSNYEIQEPIINDPNFYGIQTIKSAIENENPLGKLRELKLQVSYVIQEYNTTLTGRSYFQAEAIVDDQHFYGTGTSKKMARTEAAKEALKHFSYLSETKNVFESNKNQPSQSLLEPNVSQLLKQVKANNSVFNAQNSYSEIEVCEKSFSNSDLPPKLITDGQDFYGIETSETMFKPFPQNVSTLSDRKVETSDNLLNRFGNSSSNMKNKTQDCKLPVIESSLQPEIAVSEQKFLDIGASSKELANIDFKRETIEHFSQNPNWSISEDNISITSNPFAIYENPLSRLNELKMKITYVIQESTTSSGQPYFQGEVVVGDRHFFGIGSSKKIAKTEAAKEALKHFSYLLSPENSKNNQKELKHSISEQDFKIFENNEDPLSRLKELKLNTKYVIQEFKPFGGQPYIQAEAIVGHQHFYGSGASEKEAKTEAAEKALKHFSHIVNRDKDVYSNKKATMRSSSEQDVSELTSNQNSDIKYENTECKVPSSNSYFRPVPISNDRPPSKQNVSTLSKKVETDENLLSRLGNLNLNIMDEIKKYKTPIAETNLQPESTFSSQQLYNDTGACKQIANTNDVRKPYKIFSQNPNRTLSEHNVTTVENPLSMLNKLNLKETYVVNEHKTLTGAYFQAEVIVSDQHFYGIGTSKKIARIEAAKEALKQFSSLVIPKNAVKNDKQLKCSNSEYNVVKKVENENPISRLNELNLKVKYVVQKWKTPDWEPYYQVEAIIDDQHFYGCGASQEVAKTHAAQEALKHFSHLSYVKRQHENRKMPSNPLLKHDTPKVSVSFPNKTCLKM